MEKIKLNDGKEYPIFFDYNVLSDFQEKYGDVAALPDKMKTLKDLKWIASSVINEAIRKKNYESGTSDPEIPEFYVGMWLPTFPQETIEAIMKAFKASMGDEKNVKAATAAAGKMKQNLTQAATTAK